MAGAIGAATIGGQAVVFDEISVAGDEGFAALRAASIFPVTDHAGKIAGIDIAQSGGLTDFRSLEEIFGRGVALAIALHFVVCVERGNVPRDVGRNASQEFREAAQFVGTSLKPGMSRVTISSHNPIS